MASIASRSPPCTIIREASRHYYSFNAPRFPVVALVPSQARPFKSATNRCGHAGLAHGPISEGPMYGDIVLPQKLPSISPRTPLHPRPQPHQVRQEHDHVVQPTDQAPVLDTDGNLDLDAQPRVETVAVPAYHRGSKFDRIPYWQKIGRWKDISEEQFLSYRWNTAKDVQGKIKLCDFLNEVLPETIPIPEQLGQTQTRESFMTDVMDGIAMAPMSIRLTPHILSSIDWNNPLGDPLSRQFIPKKTTFRPDHPKLSFDSLHEAEDMPIEGLVHRYTDKCLFLAASHCPLYCRYCTRSYAVGADTETVTKASLKPKRARWNEMLDYIAAKPSIQDVVISGGDAYSLTGGHLRFIGDRLLSIPHVRRFRVATKGLCVSPSRTLDPDDDWTDELIRLSRVGRERGVHVALHTHFNHLNEFSWVTREAAQKLHQEAVVVRNQSVLLKGVNDDAETMGNLIRELADNNITPYYVYAGDMVKGVEDLRHPLQTILDLECQLRGSIAGFMTPQFVVDLPGGGGKRLAASYRSYDRETGVSTFVAPAVQGKGKEDRVYEYWDPLASLPKDGEGEGAERSRFRDGVLMRA